MKTQTMNTEAKIRSIEAMQVCDTCGKKVWDGNAQAMTDDHGDTYHLCRDCYEDLVSEYGFYTN